MHIYTDMRTDRSGGTDANDRPIEVNGNTPDIAIDVDIQDYLSGRDPILNGAVEAVLKKNQ